MPKVKPKAKSFKKRFRTKYILMQKKYIKIETLSKKELQETNIVSIKTYEVPKNAFGVEWRCILPIAGL